MIQMSPDRPSPAHASPACARSIWCLLLGLIWLWVPLGLQAAQALDSTFEEANKLFAQGNYTEAAALYERITTSGRVTPAALYNLGNAWFKAGQLGRAIAAYDRALAIQPRDPDTQANLQFAREKVSPPTVPPGRLAGLFGRLTVNEWTGLFCLGAWACFLLLAGGELLPAWRGRLRRYALWSAIVTIGLLVCLGLALRFSSALRVVVVASDAPVRTSPFDEAATSFKANDGAEFPVRDAKEGWFQIQAGPGRSGWIKGESVARLGAGN